MQSNQEYVTWNSEKYIFEDEKDLEKILSLDIEYEKQGKEWYSLSTVRAFNSGKEFLEYYFTETFPRQISWSYREYDLPDDMKVSLDKLLERLTELYGPKDVSLVKIQNIIVLFKDYMNRQKFSTEDLKKFIREITAIGLNFGVTKVEMAYVGDYKGLVEIAFEQGAHYLDEEDSGVRPEVELIRYLIDYD
ncbi:MAG: hypothetical protein ACRC54_01435 [Fusobacteriaceae bacterium]